MHKDCKFKVSLGYRSMRPTLSQEKKVGPREMVHQLRALSALPGDPCLIPSTYIMAQSSVTLVPRDPTPSSGL